MISAFVASFACTTALSAHFSLGVTILIASGFAAHRNLLDWPRVVLLAIAGVTLGDQLAYLRGRWKGEVLNERFLALAQSQLRIHDLLVRCDAIFILTDRSFTDFGLPCR
jgi:membrane protein DedA with SNARE-associated domain